MERFKSVGIVKNKAVFDHAKLDHFLNRITAMKNNGRWTRAEIVRLFYEMLPGFAHKETGKFLDERM